MAPYCDTLRATPLRLSCRQDQLAVGVCNLQQFPQELPAQYQVRGLGFGVGGATELSEQIH